MAFFFKNIKIILCQKDIVGNRSRTQVLTKNQNLPLKEKRRLKREKAKKTK